MVAQEWNWDDGKTAYVMNALVSHPLCDWGTAVLIYWYAQAPWTKPNREEVDSYSHHIYDLIEKLEKRAATAGFASSLIKYNPTDDDFGRVIENPRQYERPVASHWLRVTPGEELEGLWD